MTLPRNWDEENRISFVEKIERKIHSTRIPLKERIAHAVYRLEGQRDKLLQSENRLLQREKEMFERCVGARASHDDAHAIIFANECSEIRKMAKIISASELALERVILRLQTVEEVGDVLVQMAPIVGVVRETKGKLAGIIPEVSRELEDINSILSDTLIETGEASSGESAIAAATDEARRVLDEASAIAEQKMGEKFPELPVPTSRETQRVERVAILEGGETETVPSRDVKNEVYAYVKSSRDDLSLRKLAKYLGLPPDDVRKALDQLVNEGKIKIQ